MRAMLDAGPSRKRDWPDLARGAFDAWLHPATPSHVPAVAALVGGGLWTMVGAAVVFQPVPPDWPGYLVEIVIPALLAAGFLLVATLGCTLRLGDVGGRTMSSPAACPKKRIGYLRLDGLRVGLAALPPVRSDGPTLAAAQTFALIGTAVVGAVLLRFGDEMVGFLLVVGSVAMLIPSTTTWLVFGAAWTAVGIVLELERPGRLGPRWNAW
jgi:hypothetical protein